MTTPDALADSLARSQHELVVGAGERMVDVLHLAGVAVETLCEQGVCGTSVDSHAHHHMNVATTPRLDALRLRVSRAMAHFA